MPNKLLTRNYISTDSILTMNKFIYKKDVLRGTNIKAYIRDGMLVLETEATLLKDANIGDIVKIKTDQGKLFRAKIISNYKAIILE
jgi:flagella basal body P-ring formation protein FlgA